MKTIYYYQTPTDLSRILENSQDIDIIIASSIYFYVKFSQDRTKKLMEDKRKEEELEEAHNLQMGLLAKENPKRKDLDISTYIKCATEVGGDYYDFIFLNEDECFLCIADVSGKGMSAALLMSHFQAKLHANIKYNYKNITLKRS